VKYRAMTAPSRPLSFSGCLLGTMRNCMSIVALLVFLCINLREVPGAPGFGCPVQNPSNALAAGTLVYVRLGTPVSTKTSHLHQTVTARVVREVVSGQGVLIPIGAEAQGTIAKLIPTSDPTDRARLLIQFDQLRISGHAALPLVAHLTEVENARETVAKDGTIRGILVSEIPVSVVDNTLDKLGAAGTDLKKVSNKTIGETDTSITYPVGVDMTLMLDQPLTVDAASPAAAAMQISPSLADAVQTLLADAPQRAESEAKKPGDPLNLVIVGQADQIVNAFQQAGWSEAKKLGPKSTMGTVRAVTSEEGYSQAPVSQLYLYGHVEDLAFEKMLNTFMKRHHLRLWRTTVSAPGRREIWLGAATHDIGLDVHFGVVSHAIDPDLDAERSKVGADLIAGGQVAAEQLVTRPNPLSEGKTATGGAWKTSGQLLVIELKN